MCTPWGHRWEWRCLGQPGLERCTQVTESPAAVQASAVIHSSKQHVAHVATQQYIAHLSTQTPGPEQNILPFLSPSNQPLPCLILPSPCPQCLMGGWLATLASTFPNLFYPSSLFPLFPISYFPFISSSPISSLSRLLMFTSAPIIQLFRSRNLSISLHRTHRVFIIVTIHNSHRYHIIYISKP